MFAVVTLLLSSCAGLHSPATVPLGASMPLVTFVFDDGDDTDYLIGKRIFAEQGAVACSAITTDWINTEYHMTSDQIRAMRDAGWEIMSHTKSHPKLAWISPSQIETELSESKATLNNMGLGVKNLVYPYNNNDETVRSIGARHYRSARGGESSFNAGNVDPHFLKSFSMKHDIAWAKRTIDTAYADRSWLIFYHHEIDAKVKLTDKQGTFIHGEELRLSPSGTIARYITVHWFPIYGYHMYLAPFSGKPQPGDVITGSKSNATARIDYLLYDELEQFSEMIRYIHTQYPDMRIVTIDQGLDLLGIADRNP
jgi:peptidoglycan/xylan/chitin deacetylase (PgdA/CDA1 family)